VGKEVAIAAIKSFRHALEARGIRVARMILFGSYAAATAHEWSDIVLALISPDFEGLGLCDRINKVARAIAETNAPIEAILKTPAEWESGEGLVFQFASTGQDV